MWENSRSSSDTGRPKELPSISIAKYLLVVEDPFEFVGFGGWHPGYLKRQSGSSLFGTRRENLPSRPSQLGGCQVPFLESIDHLSSIEGESRGFERLQWGDW